MSVSDLNERHVKKEYGYGRKNSETIKEWTLVLELALVFELIQATGKSGKYIRAACEGLRKLFDGRSTLSGLPLSEERSQFR